MNTIFAPSRQKWLAIWGMVASCAMSTSQLSAQAPAARIASEVNAAEMTVIKGSQHPLANPQFDAGRVPADTRLNGISIHFNRSAAQEAELDALIAAQQDPASPQYHKWLTPDQFAARFGMAQADLAKVQTWLEQQGFSIDLTNRSRNTIRFSGTVGQVESAFQTQLHYYTVDGEKHFAPSTALSIPAAFASVASSVGNVSDFRPKPQHIIPRTQFTSGQTGNVFFTPGDIATAYSIKSLTSAGINGAGQTIAIIGQSYISVSDIEAFQSAAGVPKKDPTMVLVAGTGADSTPFAGDQSESDLDVEWSSAIAPGATVAFVYTGSNTNYGVYDSAQYAVDNGIGNIISMSYSSCETQLNSSNLSTLEAIFKQATVQGQTVMAASGDQGSTACAGSTNLTTAQQTAIAVDYPASSAYVTGIGGTEVSSNAINGGSNYSTYWKSTSGTDIADSLIKYIPETSWNDDSTTGGLSSTGGGTSALVARPSWQTGVPGIPSGTMRLVPDISFYSSPGLPGFLYCTSDTSAWASGQTGSCQNGFRATTGGTLTVAGGTSFATPIFAGMLAILNQKLNYTTGQGNINPVLYSLASNSATYAAAFHDVTSGNNNCSAGSAYCGTTLGGFTAGPVYDEVTGLGSIDLAAIAAAWSPNTGSSATLITTTTTVAAANSAPAVNASDVFTITVASSSGSTIPTGTVTLQIDGGTKGGGTTVPAQAISSNGTLSYTATFTSPCTHQVIAQYSGDGTHAPSVGIASVVVPGTCSGVGKIALAATDLTVSRGSSGSSTITVTPSAGYTGTVYLTFTTSNNTALQNLCYSFTNTLSNGDGSVSVAGTTPVTTQLSLDTKSSDCVTAAAIKSTGMHAFKTLNASGNTARNSNHGGTPGKLPAGIAFAGLVLAGFLGRASRKLRSLACVVALAAVGAALTACGSSSTGSVSNPPKGTYTITVSGQDSTTSSITATTTFAFTIK